MIIKERVINLSVILFCLISILASPLAWSGKMYKWTDKEGQVHYSQIPPESDQVQENSNVSEKSDANAISTTRKGDYAYCGKLKLPGPLYKPKTILLVLGNRVESWTKSLKQNERSLTSQLRALESKNRQKNKYKYRSSGIEYTDIAGERRRETARTIKEYRCALAWAERQKNQYTDIKQELAHDLKGAELNYKTALDAAHKECGFEPKDYASPNYNTKKSGWKKCMRPHDRKIRASERNLQKLRSQKNKLQ